MLCQLPSTVLCSRCKQMWMGFLLGVWESFSCGPRRSLPKLQSLQFQCVVGHFVALCTEWKAAAPLSLLFDGTSEAHTRHIVHHVDFGFTQDSQWVCEAACDCGYWFCLLVQRGCCTRWCLVLLIQSSIARLPSYTLRSQVLGTLTLKACEWLAPSDSKVIATVLLVLAMSCAYDLPCHRSQITIFPSLSVPSSQPHPPIALFLAPPSQ